jgi:hypothetical protein
VTCLQQALIAGGYSIPAGATGYFGAQTQAAVAAWQKATGVAPAVGYFGAISRAHWNLGGSSSNTTTTTTTTTTTGTTGNTTYTGGGNGLKVFLSATSPNGSVLVEGQGIGDLGDFVFANPTASPINVTNLTFNRTGVSNDSTLVNVYLYNGVNRITDSAGVSSSAFSYSDPVALFTVPAGQTYTVSVRSDILSTASGQQLGVSLVSATASSALDSSVSFPISSGYQTISAASLATVSFGATTLPSGTAASPTTISPQSAYPIWQNTVSVSTNPVKLSEIEFTNLGSIDSTYVANVRLFVDGVQVGATLPTLAANRTATFDLSAAPVLLSTSSHIIKVFADLTGGSGRTLQLSVQRSSDAMFIDSQLNQPVTPKNSGSTFSAISGGVIEIAAVTASTGVSVTTDPASPNTNIPYAGTSLKLATFDMLASGENVKVSDLWVYATNTIHATAGLANGKVYVNGVQVGSTKAIGASATDFSMGSSMILPAGQTVTVDIYADAKTGVAGTGSAPDNAVANTNLTATESTQIFLAGETGNAQGQSSLVTTGVPYRTAVYGNSIEVVASSLAATKYSGYGNQTMIAGTNSAKIGAFTLSAGSTEGISVNTIAIDMSTSNAASITNLTLKDDASGATLGTIITTPASGANSYSVSFDIPASQSKTVDVYGNVLSSAGSGGTINLGLDATTGGTGDVTGTTAYITGTTASNTTDTSSLAGTGVDTTVPLQVITVGQGSLTAALGAGDPQSAIVIAGASQLHAGQFTFSSQYSPYTVDGIAILIPSGAATSVSSVSLAYTDKNGNAQTASAALHLPNTTQPYATAVFTGLTMYVPANSTANLDVYVNTPTIASGATSGAAISVSLSNAVNAYGGNGFHATNSAGAAKTSLAAQVNSNDTVGQGTFVLRESIPTLSAVSVNSGNVLASGANQPLAELKVSSDPAGATGWDKLAFTVSQTYPAAATSFAIGATSTLAMYSSSNGSSWTAVSGRFATSTAGDIGTGAYISAANPWGAGSTGGYLVFLPTSEQQVPAGQSEYYQVRGTVAGVSATGGYNLSFSIANPNSVIADLETAASTAVGTSGGSGVTADATIGSFTWSDRSYIGSAGVHTTATPDWTNDYLVPGLSLSFPTLTTSY